MRRYLRISTEDVLHAARTGQSAFEHGHQASWYEYVAGHPEAEAAWNATMTSRASRLASSLAELIDWTGALAPRSNDRRIE